MVNVISNAEIYCDEIGGRMCRCDFFSLLANSQHCGSCPLCSLGEEFYNITFYVSLRDELGVHNAKPDDK